MRIGRIQNDIDVLWDLAVHDIAILEFISKSRALNVRAIPLTKLINKVTSVLLFIQYENFNASINCSWLSPLKVRDI